MFFVIFGFLFFTFFIIAGVTFIAGTLRQWPLFVNPPKEKWLVYSQSFIKQVCGTTGLLVFNYLLGILFILLGFIGTWNGLKQVLNLGELYSKVGDDLNDKGGVSW